MKEVIIAGGTGLIGRRLANMLLTRGYRVNILSRSSGISNTNDLQYFKWDISKKELPVEIFQRADYVINLSGTNVGDRRWNKRFKKEILNSRLESTRLIVYTLNNNEHKVKAFLNGSAIGYYGFHKSVPATEDDEPGDDFMAEVCIEWEKEANKLNKNTRLVISRTGIVFSSLGGALDSMAKPIKLFAGSDLGYGHQICSWVHIDDACRAMIFALENDNMRGAFNNVSPLANTNHEITRILAKELHCPLIMPHVPAFVLKIILGEFADSVIGSLPIYPKKLEDCGFVFNYPKLKEAINDLYSNKK